jgi:hypothetical protein
MRSEKIFWLALAMVCSFMIVTLPLEAQTPAWTQLGTGGQSFNLFRAASTTVYDGVTNEMILFGGYSSDASLGNPRLNDLWILTGANGLSSGGWTNIIANGTAGSPTARYNHSAVLDGTNNRLIIYGGCEGGCYPIGNDIWVLTNANGQGAAPAWQQLFPAGGSPPPRHAHQAVYDPTTNSMIIWGGQNGGGYCGGYSDVWVLSNANGLGGTPVWSQLSPHGIAPLGDYYSSATYDPTNNVMMVYGGFAMAGNCSPNWGDTPTNTVWTLSHANGTGGTPTWTKLRATGLPTGRAQAAAVYNPGSNRMTIFGGYGGTKGELSDAWVLANANGLGGTPAWTRMSPTGTTKPAVSIRWNNVGIDLTNDRMIMTLGYFNEGPLYSTWVLSAEDNQ